MNHEPMRLRWERTHEPAASVAVFALIEPRHATGRASQPVTCVISAPCRLHPTRSAAPLLAKPQRPTVAPYLRRARGKHFGIEELGGDA